MKSTTTNRKKKKEYFMNQIFDLNETRRQQIIVEYLTPTGSGFAVTPKGDQVFLNSRLVSTMKVQPGDISMRFCCRTIQTSVSRYHGERCELNLCTLIWT